MEKMLNINGNLAMQQGERRIITIAANEKPETVILRVAAYCRVSSASDEQLNSYAAQNRYYTDLIAAHSDWKLVDVYADEGISGTSADKRDDFQRLMADCRRGLIDRVLTKSISRFARNTKDCLEAIRELRSIGVSVAFEKENIDTSAMSSEMITAVMASLAQKESESIGSNMQWSYQKRMESGEYNTNCAPFGYRLVGSKLEIEESEAEIIRLIFRMYLSGLNRNEIARKLQKMNAQKSTQRMNWNPSTIYHILNNERYAGNALLAEYITTGTFPHRRVPNHGEKQKYYVEESNPPIISQKEFEQAQALARRRRTAMNNTPTEHLLRKTIYCSKCGATFKRQNKTGNEYWVCYNKFESNEICNMQPVYTSSIEEAFCRLYYKLKHNGEPILRKMISTYLEIKSRKMLWSLDVIELNKRISNLTNQNQLLTMLKKQGLVDSDLFISRSNAIAEQLQKVKTEKSRILETEGDVTVQQTEELIRVLTEGPDYIASFDTALFHDLVNRIVVKDGENIIFVMNNGLEFKEAVERMKR